METNAQLSFCPRCGGNHFKTGAFKPWKCPDCGLVFFQNTAAAAGALVLNDSGHLLMVQRSKNPAAGKWGLPGGFIDDGERVEDALIRECWEEIGLKVSNLQYLAGLPNVYPYGGLVYHTLDLYFTANATNPEAIQPKDEVDNIAWFDPKTIDMDQVAFESCREAIWILNTRR